MAYIGTHTPQTGGAAQTTVTANMIELTIGGQRIGRAQNASSRIDWYTRCLRNWFYFPTRACLP